MRILNSNFLFYRVVFSDHRWMVWFFQMGSEIRTGGKINVVRIKNQTKLIQVN